MATALVTGGAGFIGSHIVEELLRRGDSVRVLDNFSSGRRENLENLHGRLEVLEGDLRDRAKVTEAVRDAEWIFHEAAFVSNPKSMLEPQTCYDVNVGGTGILLEAARLHGVQRVVIASSAAVYGDNPDLPLAEDAPLRPLSPYAASKQIAEIYAGLYTRSFGVDVAALRYFNVYGPRQSPDTDYAAAIPIFIRRLLSGQAVSINGDGGQTRDLIYVKDVVQANLLAAGHPRAGGQVLNICTGEETRILDLAEMLQKLIPGAPAMEFTAPRPGDIYRSAGSPEKAASILGFRVGTALAEGLQRTMEWMRQ